MRHVRRWWPHILAVALALGTIAYTTTFSLGVRARAACQHALNQVEADQAAATAKLMEVIFTSDELEQQLGGYADYLDAYDDVKRRRAALDCG